MSNNTDAENTNANRSMTFNSNGVTWNSDTGNANASGGTYVLWNWNAGGSTASNSDGSITSSVRANTTAGFSIVGYTGNGTSNSDVTIGHGLGVTPDVVIIKKRGSGGSEGQWGVLHKDLSSGKNIFMQTTSAEGTYSNKIKSMESTTFTINVASASAGRYNRSGETYIAYVFSGVAGYSKFGSYTGNNANDGTFVFTGFRPAWLMVKRIDSTRDWLIYDNKISTFNVIDDFLEPNNNTAEQSSSSNSVDFVSNGFKFRNNSGDMNGAGTYIYMAFAKSPFKYSRAL